LVASDIDIARRECPCLSSKCYPNILNQGTEHHDSTNPDRDAKEKENQATPGRMKFSEGHSNNEIHVTGALDL
jgi:hypothetical protein